MQAKDECDIAISIDCDGQDDINALDKMVDEFFEGITLGDLLKENEDNKQG